MRKIGKYEDTSDREASMKSVKKMYNRVKTKVKYYTDAEGWLKWWTKKQAIKLTTEIAKTMKPVDTSPTWKGADLMGSWDKTRNSLKPDVPEGTIVIRTNRKQRNHIVRQALPGKYKTKYEETTTIVVQVEDKTIVEEISSGKRQAASKD